MLQTFTSTEKQYFSPTLHYPSTEDKTQKEQAKSPWKVKIKTTFIVQKDSCPEEMFQE